jgi:hypothetical protein
MLDEATVFGDGESGSGGGTGDGGGGASDGASSGSVGTRRSRGGAGGAGDAGGIGGAGDSTGTRKRGRPRKVVELAGEVPSPTLTDKPSRGRKKGPDLTVLVETTVVGLFGLVAVATAHEHWLKDREDVMAITGPLNAWIDQLPSKTLKKLEKNLAPTLFVVGLATVVGPDVVLEMKLRAHQNARPAVPRSQDRSQSADPIAGRFTSEVNGAGVHPRGEAGWAGGIPTVPHLSSEYDV